MRVIYLCFIRLIFYCFFVFCSLLCDLPVHAVAQLIETLRYKSEGRRFDSYRALSVNADGLFCLTENVIEPSL